MHAASHIDRKHIAALLRCSYTVDYVDAVLLDERSSLAVPAIHAFLKTFFPKLASHVLTEQTCSIIDNLVSTLTSMVEVVDVQESAHRLTGDLRALALVYSSGADIKPPPTLHAALETLLTRTKAARARLKESKQQQPDIEAPTKKRKFNTSDEIEHEEDDDNEDDEEEGSASSPGMEDQKESNESSSPQSTSAATVGSTATTASTTCMTTTSTPSVTTAAATGSPATTSIKEKSKEQEEAQAAKPNEAEKTDQTDAKSSSSLITASSTTSNWNSQLCRSMNNVSWLDMLEKTIANLQMIVQFQTKN